MQVPHLTIPGTDPELLTLRKTWVRSEVDVTRYDVLSFMSTDKVVDVWVKTVTVQRNWATAKPASFPAPSTPHWTGPAVFRQDFDQQLGYPQEHARPYQSRRSGGALKPALREIASFHTGELFLTDNENLITSNVAPEYRLSTQTVMQQDGVAVDAGRPHAGLLRGTLAGVVLHAGLRGSRAVSSGIIG